VATSGKNARAALRVGFFGCFERRKKEKLEKLRFRKAEPPYFEELL
jgi:hypothetical protein